ncbi:MAG: site-specific integrase [Lentimicrobium sp.]|nr:site-specific integrase [Lentimicrobium sp.]
MRRISGTYKFKMRTTAPNSNNEYAILLEISKSGKRGYISLKVSGNRDDWDEEQERFIIKKGLRTAEGKMANEERKLKNDFIEKLNIRIKDIISQFEKNNTDWTINQFKTEFLGKKNHSNAFKYFKKHIDNLLETGHTGNARVYSETLHMLELFDKKFASRVFSEIDLRYIKSFDTYLQKRAVSGNARSVYLRTIRSMLNKAIQDKEASAETYPFGKGGFQIGSIETRTAKRYLPREQLEILKNNQSIIPSREFARCIFLFSYYCQGINFVDMAKLKTSNIIVTDKGKRILYKREKTKNKKNAKPLDIKISSEIQELIDLMKTYKLPLDNYLLPIVTVNHKNQKKLYDHIKNRGKRVNKNLKDLGEDLGFELKLTTYVSRHTMAMQLQSNKIPVEIISQVLGHQDIGTTKIYLDDLDNSVIDEAVKVL